MCLSETVACTAGVKGKGEEEENSRKKKEEGRGEKESSLPEFSSSSSLLPPPPLNSGMWYKHFQNGDVNTLNIENKITTVKNEWFV